MIKVGVIGATGYTGVELVRLLARHPGVEIVGLTSQTYNEQSFGSVFPSAVNFSELVLEPQDAEDLAQRCDVIYTALPHGVSMDVVEIVANKGKKVIDLGADYRFDEVAVYEEWYRVQHKTPQLAVEAVYGLPELYRDRISRTNVIGNPGCYPTSVILGLAPLLKNGLIDPATIIADSKSGASGAGRGLNLAFHYSECNENFKAYNIGAHRHTPEIEQELGKLAGQKLTISFTPHLVPMTRGILSTIYVSLKEPGTTGDLLNLYNEFYQDDYFVRIHPQGQYPQTKWVYGSNFCDIGLTVDARTGRVVVVSAIDNLVKGASGQAVQNMNIMFGLPEKTGIDFAPVFP
ncbi:MAG: N-acetyl-gamma-glutamyl-phosphate reductase [Thermincola sp.]|jgi:N-acetyl-gamma-glutamyl-phosphate reductase|nr:N-acetyl-gamma-glutamyl-phosphate reductase [Thermincola sp.]MDT3704812.1 N-acetyl-gamma-glutamyl-phosphate reductase [Thermincola sp.]